MARVNGSRREKKSEKSVNYAGGGAKLFGGEAPHTAEEEDSTSDEDNNEDSQHPRDEDIGLCLGSCAASLSSKQECFAAFTVSGRAGSPQVRAASPVRWRCAANIFELSSPHWAPNFPSLAIGLFLAETAQLRPDGSE